jgi:hypothetical protein
VGEAGIEWIGVGIGWDRIAWPAVAWVGIGRDRIAWPAVAWVGVGIGGMYQGEGALPPAEAGTTTGPGHDDCHAAQEQIHVLSCDGT